MLIIHRNGHRGLKSRNKSFFKISLWAKNFNQVLLLSLAYFLPKSSQNTYKHIFFLTWDEMGCLARPWVAFAISFIPDVILVGGLEKTRPPKEGGIIHRPGPGPSVIRSHPHWHKSGMTRGAMALWAWAQNQHPRRRTITWVHDDGTGGGSQNLMTGGGQAPEGCKVCSCGYKAHCLFTQKEPF